MLALAPVLPFATADLHLTHAQAQLIFALPVVLMGLLSLPCGALSDRVGARNAIAAGLALTAAGELLRATAGGFGPLFGYTLLFGAGLSLAQPALPKLIKDHFSDRSTVATGLYSMGFVVAAAVAGWLTVPWLLHVAGGWRGTFVVWGVVAAVSLLAWLLLWPGGGASGGRSRAVDLGAAWRLPGIGRVAALYIGQSIAFYTLSAWLPTYFHELGWSVTRAQVAYGTFESVSIPATVLAPWLMERLARRRPVAVVAALGFLAGIAGFTLLPGRLTLLWAILAGATNPVFLILAMALPVELAPAHQVASATGFILTVAYVGAIAGPPLAGLLRDLTGLPAAGLWPCFAGALTIAVASGFVPEATRKPRPGG